MNKTRIDFAQIPWEEQGAGVRSKAFVRDGRKLRLVEFTSDFRERDWCTKAHAGYVLEGEMEIAFDDGVEKFAHGDGIFIAGGRSERHKLKVTGERARLVLLEDY